MVCKIIKSHINSFDHAEVGVKHLHARLRSDVMLYVNIHAYLPEPLDTNTSDSIRTYVKHLDDNLRYFGEKLSQSHRELVVKRLKNQISC